MIPYKHILVLWMLALPAGIAASQSRDKTSEPVAEQMQAKADGVEGGWLSYRDAYRAMLWFEKYGKPKNLIQNRLQLIPKDPSASLDGLRLTLVTQSTQLNLPLDVTGRTLLPLLKAAYDENAELRLNRKMNQYRFQSRVSIVIRADGVYETADLRAACEQVLAYQRSVESSFQGKKCVGVRLAYSPKNQTITGEPVVELRNVNGNVSKLPVSAGSAFVGMSDEEFQIINASFSNWSEKSQLITRSMPLAISALFE
jgi:hypothetical protein